MKSTYVFGHRNPDTDSVCAAISFSYLKNQMGGVTCPRVLGHINKETKFVLNYFGVKEPDYLNNVKVQLRNVNYHKGVMLSEYASLKEVIDYMQEQACTAIPIVDQKKHLKSFITLKEIAMVFIEEAKDHLYTSYDHLLHSLKGREILRFQEEFEGRLVAGSYQSQTFITESTLQKGDILIVGDRYKVIEHALLSGISLLVVTHDFDLDPHLLELAKEKKVSVITSQFDTYNTCNQITLSNYVKSLLLNLSPSVFHELDYLSDFLEEASRRGHTNYPVLNKRNECLGLIRITDALHYEKKDVILVDHNNLEQSVPGIEEARIVEIIDHHNLGAIGTNVPINFRSMPVGSTCTILYYLYQEAHVTIPKDIAGLMMAAILSDTLLLKSPTTTEVDKEVVRSLAEVSGIDYETFGYQMLKAGSSVEGMEVEDIIYQDFKSYKVGTSNLGISQIVTMDFESMKDSLEDYVAKLNEIAKGAYDTVVLFITDVFKNGSYVLYNDAARRIIEDSFDLESIEEGTFISNLVSRKKQMLPKIMEVLERNVS